MSGLISAIYAKRVAQRCREFRLDTKTTKHIYDAANWIVNGRTNGLLLQGQVGTGKSTLAWSIKEALITCGNKCHWTSATDLIRARFDKESQSCLFEERRKARILFIDELGIESDMIKHYGNEERPMRDIFNSRYDNHSAITVATTNLTPDEFKAFYGKRIDDRFAETYSRIGYDGSSYRRQ